MLRRRSMLAALAALGALTLAPAAEAQAKKDFKVAWSIYVGWMPWGHAADTGIVRNRPTSMASPSR